MTDPVGDEEATEPQAVVEDDPLLDARDEGPKIGEDLRVCDRLAATAARVAPVALVDVAEALKVLVDVPLLFRGGGKL